MFKPLKYIQSRIQTEADFNYVIKKYWKSLRLKEFCSVLEIGCGPGNCTYNSLLPIFPNTLKTYIAVDKAEDMVNYANTHYQVDSRLQFKKLDILTNSIPRCFQENFDHTISFHCFHFISDHRKALQNIYGMTRPGGDVFVTFIGKNFIFEIYKTLAQEEKWKPFLKDYKDIICPTHVHDNPEVHYNEVLKEAGFSPDFCVSKRKIFIYPKKIFIDLMDAVCTFNVPEDMMGDFLAEHIKIMEKYDLVDTNEVEEEFIHFPYTLLIAYASKK